MKAKSILDKISVPHSTDPRPESEPYDIMAMIDGYENEGREILKAGGYPLTVREIIYSRHNGDGMPLGKNPVPRRIKDVMNMLEFFSTVRYYIQKNDISRVACFMAYGVQSAMKAKMRPAEEQMDKGASLEAREKKSLETREIKKKIMRETILRIFEKFSKLPKTLGTVWTKFDHVNKGIRFLKEYRVETGKDAQGRDVVIITGDDGKMSEYSKRSLQHFIDELK